MKELVVTRVTFAFIAAVWPASTLAVGDERIPLDAMRRAAQELVDCVRTDACDDSESYRERIRTLATFNAQSLRHFVEIGSLDGLTRRLVIIAIDLKENTGRHQELERYRSRVLEPPATSNRISVSRGAGNHPPPVLPVHLDQSYRLAWESLLIEVSWWPAKETAAGAIGRIGAEPSLVILGLALRKASSTYQEDRDLGWQRRAIVALILAILDAPGEEALEQFVEAYVQAREPGIQDLIAAHVCMEPRWLALMQDNARTGEDSKLREFREAVKAWAAERLDE